MIDAYLARKSSARDRLSTPGYTPDQALTATELSNPYGARLATIFPPWHGGEWYVGHFAKCLRRRGYAVLELKLHDDILKDDVEEVKESFSFAQGFVAGQLEKEAKSYEGIDLFGHSIGNVLLALVAESFPDFAQATLVVAGGDLATATMKGIRTQTIREGFEVKGVTQSELEVAWSYLAPSTHADAFRGKRVMAIPSRVDQIIPSYTQFNFIEELQESGADISTRVSSVGHYATVGAHYMFGSTKF